MKINTVLIIWLIFIASHFVNFFNIPIFEDEAEYLLLAQKIIESPVNNFFIYSHNGLFPLFGWLVALGGFLISDTLFVGRVLNILLSSLLVFWLYKIGKLYNLSSRYHWFSQALLLTSPIILLNSRIALLDTSVMVYTAWYIYFLLSYTKEHKFILALMSGLFFLAAMFTKATGIFGLPACLLIIYFLFRSKRKRQVTESTLVFLGAFIITWIYYSRFGKQISSDSGSSLSSYNSIGEFLTYFKTRLWVTFHWFNAYYLPYFLLPIIYFANRENKYIRQYAPHLAWIITSFIIMLSLNKFYYPRHILIVSAPLIVVFSGFLGKTNRNISLFVLILSVIFQSVVSYKILFNPENSPFALEDRFEYFENYTSGRKIDEISKYLKGEAKDEKIIVYLDGSYVMEYGLRRSLEKNKDQISIKSFRLNDNYFPVNPKSIEKEGKYKTYVVVNRWAPPNISKMTLMATFNVSFRHTQYVYQLF